jgi:uncharacterized membrane protein SirB2
MDYLLVRQIHITCVVVSLALFVLRGGLMLAESRLLQHPVLRYLPHLVDTVLLMSALVLTTIIRQYPFQQPWLTAKVVGLVAYVVLGSIALKRGPTRAIRGIAFIAALAVVGFIVSVARLHDPRGLLAVWPG